MDLQLLNSKMAGSKDARLCVSVGRHRGMHSHTLDLTGVLQHRRLGDSGPGSHIQTPRLRMSVELSVDSPGVTVRGEDLLAGELCAYAKLLDDRLREPPLDVIICGQNRITLLNFLRDLIAFCCSVVEECDDSEQATRRAPG